VNRFCCDGKCKDDQGRGVCPLDFADTEPFPPPGADGNWVILAAVVGLLLLILIGVWHE
jgi:hypothetical protein